MRIIKNIGLSCGIRLLSNFDDAAPCRAGYHNATQAQTAAEVVRRVQRRMYTDNPFSTVVFSHRANDGYFKALINYIRRNKLGRVTLSPGVVNPNSHNTIRTAIWDLDRDNLREHTIPPIKLKKYRLDYIRYYW
jgi:hypothetical protein